MNNIKYIKEPGYMYDLFFLFVLYFNKEFCLTNYINYNKSSEDTAYFNKLLNEFDDISDYLFPFFYMKDNTKCFMTQFYYEPYEAEFTTTYNLNLVQSELTNHEKIIANLVKFYFTDITEQMLSECVKSVSATGRLIRDSKYNDRVKSSLYSFFLEPIPVIQKLSYELMSKEFQFAQQYEKNFRKISKLQQEIDIENLSAKLKQSKIVRMNIDSFDDLYISFCLNAKNCIRTHYYKDKAVLLLGTDYNDYADYLIIQNRLPELDVFGNAISESNRIDILDLIVRKEEITIKDLEQVLGFTGTNAYYHLSLMIKANMIKSRNQGRTVLYSINKDYFDVVCNMLSKYSNKSERR